MEENFREEITKIFVYLAKLSSFLGILENAVPFATGKCRKFRPDVLTEWKAGLVNFVPEWRSTSKLDKTVPFNENGREALNQPRSQVLSPTRRETLVGFGHVSPRIWEITNKRFGGGADKCEICLYKA